MDLNLSDPTAEEQEPKILVIDDNLTNLKVALDYLEDYDFDVMVSQSGEEAFETLHHALPDLILLDVMMPVLNGFEVCRRLKADARTRHIPVIFMTALDSQDDKLKGFDAGGVDYVTKPLQHRELVARMTTHLTIVRQRQQLEQTLSKLQKAYQDLRVMHDVEQEFMRIEEERKQRLARLSEAQEQNFSIVITIPDHIEGLIFDCDGTLADTVPQHISAFQEVIKQHGGDLTTAFLKTCRGLSDEKVIERINEILGYAIDPVQGAHKKEVLFLEKYIVQVQPIQPIIDVAKRHYGMMPMAVATGGVRRFANPILKIVGIVDLFNTLVTSEDVQKGKPNPDLFLEAARRINVPPERCHVFEDADSGLEAAHRAGMTATDVRQILGVL